MTIPGIRDSIISKLIAYIGYKVIDADTTNKKKDYPYGSYKIITPFVSTFENANIEYKTDAGDTTETYGEDGTISFSFIALSDEMDQAYNEALKMWNYFRHKGRESLYANGIVVLEVQNIIDRNVLISDLRERKQGFDVMFRVENVTVRDIVPIESVEVTFN